MATFATPGDAQVGYISGAGDPVDAASCAFPPQAEPDMGKVMAAAQTNGMEIFPPQG